MLILKMAWKNMLRYKKRTLVTACAISFGIIFSMLFDGLLFGMANESSINLLEYETSGVQFFGKGYFADIDKMPLDKLIERTDVEKIESFLDENKTAYTKEIVSACEIYFNEDYFETSGSISSILIGLDTQKAQDVFSLHKSVESGTWLKDDEGETYCTGAVIGSWIADDMKAEPGWYITIQCKGRGGFTQTIDVPIIGIIHCPDVVVNSSCVFMDIDYLDEMLEMEGAVTSIDAYCGSAGQVDRNAAKLISQVQKAGLLEQTDGVEFKTWREIESDALSVQNMCDMYCAILMAFMFIIAAVGISNTMLMSVLERKNEIAMLKAMGYSPYYIKRLFMWEGVSIGVIGCIIGLTVGCLINIPLVTHGIDLTSALSDVDIGYRISGIMKSGWDIPGFLRITIGALIVAGVAAYIPTGSTVRKEIADIFRNV